MNAHSSAQALRRSRREPEAFAGFYEEHVESLLAYVMRRVWDVDVALDLTAESFAQAYLGRRRFRGSTEAEAAGWLYGIARRQLALYFRKSAVEKRALQRLGLQAPRFDEEEEARLRDLAEPDGLRAVVRLELERAFGASARGASAQGRRRTAVHDVADSLGISQQAARARVARGLKTLAAALDRQPSLKEGML